MQWRGLLQASARIYLRRSHDLNALNRLANLAVTALSSTEGPAGYSPSPPPPLHYDTKRPLRRREQWRQRNVQNSVTHVQIFTFLKFLLPSPSSLLKLPNNKPPDRVPKILTFKMRQSSQLFLWKWVLLAWECKIISISKAAHLTSFWYRGLREHGHGPFTGPLAKTTIEQIVKGGGSYQKHFCKFLKILFQWVLYYVTPIITNFFWKGGLSNTQELSRVVWRSSRPVYQKSGRGFKGKRAVTTRQGK